MIRQGDYLLSVAHQFGFDADTVWNDPSNAHLQKLRSNPNILFAGDVLQIPDDPLKPPPGTSLAPGSTNSFVSDAPTVTISLKFAGADPSDYASKAFTIQELAQLTGLTTDGSGTAVFQAPVTLATATLTFTGTGEAWSLSIGGVDPIATLSGVFQRLQNLGYIDGSLQFDPTNLDLMRGGLAALKAAQAPGSSPSAAAPPSAPASSPAPASTATASTPQSSSPASGPTPSPSSPAPSGPASSPAPPSSAVPSGPAPSSQPSPPSSPSSGPASAPVDNAGLADDGTLDPDVSTLLQNAHGC